MHKGLGLGKELWDAEISSPVENLLGWIRYLGPGLVLFWVYFWEGFLWRELFSG